MKAVTPLTCTVLALAGWFALASASTLKNASFLGYQVAQNEENEGHQRYKHDWKDHGNEWHQKHRGYDRKNPGDQWYQGQRGHWYRESNGWQFGSYGLVCNAQGRNCHRGGYIPANGAGMVNSQNSNLYWGCDPDGHHCHWKPRPRY